MYKRQGHNRWSKIKHKKTATDAQKSKVFGKIAQLLTVEAKRCGGDRNSPGLKAIIEKAKSINMPAQNITRAIERGDSDTTALEKVTYEAYGPGGCALLIETVTDNKNRTAAEIRHTLSKHGISMGAQGSAVWMFTVKNNTITPKTTVHLTEEDEEKLTTIISDLMDQEDTQEVHTNKSAI